MVNNRSRASHDDPRTLLFVAVGVNTPGRRSASRSWVDGVDHSVGVLAREPADSDAIFHPGHRRADHDDDGTTRRRRHLGQLAHRPELVRRSAHQPVTAAYLACSADAGDRVAGEHVDDAGTTEHGDEYDDAGRRISPMRTAPRPRGSSRSAASAASASSGETTATKVLHVATVASVNSVEGNALPSRRFARTYLCCPVNS